MSYNYQDYPMGLKWVWSFIVYTITKGYDGGENKKLPWVKISDP